MLLGRSVFAFSGIVRNDDFRKGLEKKGLHVKGFLEFPDHHPYSPADMKTIISETANLNPPLMATTLKDMARIQRMAPFPLDLVIMDAGISFGQSENDFLDTVLMKAGLASPTHNPMECR
jgi:tetraacyldisaccharide-1-P 4'-kinase